MGALRKYAEMRNWIREDGGYDNPIVAEENCVLMEDGALNIYDTVMESETYVWFVNGQPSRVMNACGEIHPRSHSWEVLVHDAVILALAEGIDF